MKLRHISIIGGIILSLFIFASHFLISNTVIMNGFEEIERRHVLEKLHAAQNELQNTVQRLDSFVWDWASWDDTYMFAQTANKDYVNSNLIRNTFYEQNLSAVIIRDSTGNILFSQAYTPDGMEDRILLADTLSLMADELPSLETDGGRGGISLLGGELNIIASRPILTSEGRGPAMGTITMVRRLSPKLISNIGKDLKFHIEVISPDSDENLVSLLNASASNERVTKENTSHISGSSYLRAIGGDPAGIIRVTIDKSISQYGAKVAVYNSIIIAAAILLFSTLIYIILHNKLLKRLETLDRQVANIQGVEHDNMRVHIDGDDEIAMLANSINLLLEELDVSHRQLVARSEELSDNEQFLQQVLDSITVGILLIDPETRQIKAINEHALSMTGRKRDEVLGKVCHKLTCPSEINNCPILDKNQSRDLSRRKLLLSTGETIPIMKSVSFVSQQGKSFLLETLIDITEIEQSRRELEKIKEGLEQTVEERTRDLAEANQELIALDKAKTLFLSSASHELRTPLTSILGFLKLMEKNFAKRFQPHLDEHEMLKPYAKRFSENLRVVRSEAERLGRLVNDLLDLNKIESGRMEWRDEPLDIRKLIIATAQAFAGQANQKEHVEFIVEPPEKEIMITADRDRMHQVLFNLLNNAFKFTNQGYVKLSTELEELNQTVSLLVCDTGSGIPEADKKQVFDLFYQVQDVNKRSSKAPGTGLGLAICRQIVTHYGGQIMVESKEGQGSCFVVRIPLQQPTETG